MMEFRGFKGSKCVDVGDNHHKGFVTAKKVSLLTVQIPRQDEREYSKTPPAPGYEADRTILCLTELETILRSIHELCLKSGNNAGSGFGGDRELEFFF